MELIKIPFLTNQVLNFYHDYLNFIIYIKYYYIFTLLIPYY